MAQLFYSFPVVFDFMIRRTGYAQPLLCSRLDADFSRILCRSRRPSCQPRFDAHVTGTRIGHYKDGPVPVDLSAVTVAANVPDGSGGYTVISGTGTSTGTFSIPQRARRILPAAARPPLCVDAQ